jgi:mevalonate kinase
MNMDPKHPFRTFNGKIMLFGEYSVMEGSWASVVPFTQVHARLTIGETLNSQEAVDSNRSLRAFAGYLADWQTSVPGPASFDLKRFKRDLDKGLFLESTIPQNYGLGSSGALCAAVFEAYHTGPEPDPGYSKSQLREIFSGMETFFHGSSSGVDPLCIFLGDALVIRDREYILPGKEGNELSMFLIDTGHTSHTGPYVRYFREQLASPGYKNEFTENYIPVVNHAVEEWVAGILKMDTVLDLSARQMVLFERMMPVPFQEAWTAGLDSGLYALKLCGSGGGGMLLGFTRDLERSGDWLLNNFSISIKPYEGSKPS